MSNKKYTFNVEIRTIIEVEAKDIWEAREVLKKKMAGAITVNIPWELGVDVIEASVDEDFYLVKVNGEYPPLPTPWLMRKD